jgi:hypothetical protein
MKECASVAKPVPAKPAPAKVTLKDIINGQSSAGYWTSRDLVVGLASGLSEEKLREAVGKLGTTAIDIVVFTLMALWILEQSFEDQEDEWQMIAAKAKTFLKTHGINKVGPLLNSCKV